MSHAEELGGGWIVANQSWIYWPHDDCPECGGDIWILTDCPQTAPGVENAFFDGEPPYTPPYCWCGDKWRCQDGHVGTVYCDAETPVQIEQDVPLSPATPATPAPRP